MELQRVAAASTFVSWPQLNAAGDPLSGLTVTGQWMAWGDTAGPSQQGNPGFVGLSGLIQEVAKTGVYSVALATTELPAASPYVMLKFTNANAATQYILIRTSSFYANITGINGTNIVAPVTAGYMPVDVKQTISLSAPADNSIEKGLARAYAASNYADIRAISGTALAAPVTAGYMPVDVKQTISLTAPADNSIEKSLARSYMAATNYIDAAVSSRSTLAGSQTIDQTTAISGATDNSIGKVLSRLYHATAYLDAAVSSRSAPATAQTIDQTTALSGSTDNSIGKTLSRLYHATAYLDAAVSTRSAPATAQTIDQTTALSGGTDNSIGKTLSRLYHATAYLDAAVSSRSAPATGQTIDQTVVISGSTDNSIGKLFSRLYHATAYLDTAISTAGSTYADALLGRTLTRGASGGRTVQQALQAIRNRVNLTSGTLSVYSNDDSTVEWTASVATQAVTAVITDIDPA